MAPVRRSKRPKPQPAQHHSQSTTSSTSSKPLPKSKPIKSTTLPPHLQSLQHSLAITPKTTLLLSRAFPETNTLTYRHLATESPNTIIAQLKSNAGVSAKEVEWFRRPLRRMVWLATFEEGETEAKARQTAEPGFWTVRHLTEMGVWVEGWDEMVGTEVRRILDEKGI